jgi:NAD(P)-dependent dehydrogenase (short-subunit alcohol dehydrogenase family)
LTQDKPERAFKAEAMRTPLGRIVQPSDVAAATLFLASQDAAFITGQVLALSGGQVM